MLRQRKDGRADGDAVDRMDSSKPTWKVLDMCFQWMHKVALISMCKKNTVDLAINAVTFNCVRHRLSDICTQ